MIKRWFVKCEINMDAQNEVNVIVKSNTERKAKQLAINECYNKGYLNVRVISCDNISSNEEEV